MNDRETKLKALLGRARELSARDDLNEEETKELGDKMVEAKDLQSKIHQDRSIDEFTRTISDDVKPEAEKPVASKDVPLLRSPEGYTIFADRKGWAHATEQWKSGRKDAPWAFDVHFKANETSESLAGALDFQGASVTEQYGGAVSPFYFPGIIEPATREPRVADLFAQGSTDSNLVRLVRESTTVNNAAVSDEMAAYGISQIQVQPQDYPVRDITTLLPVSEDILSDIPAISAYLGMRLSKFVQIAEEDQLVTGDGTGLNLLGLAGLATTDASQGTDDIASAVMKLQAAVWAASFMQPSWALMHPTNWAAYVTSREDLGGGAGAFLAGAASQAAVRQIWGLPITVTPACPVGKVYLGSSQAGMIFRNGGLRVESSTGYGTFFGQGLVALRAKVRTAFAVFRESAIGELTLA